MTSIISNGIVTIEIVDPKCPYGRTDSGKRKCVHEVYDYYCKKCPGKGICQHRRRRITCKECKGTSICKHGEIKWTCKKCDGSQICEHKRIRTTCRDCGGGGVCEHGRTRSICKDCGGGSICEHGKVRSHCRDCKGGSVCEHGRIRSYCKECDGGAMCIHGREKRRCKECEGNGICEHKKVRSRCKECGGNEICEHGRHKYQCKDCGGSQICDHDRIRSGCKDCRRNLPLEKVLSRYKHACSICGANISTSKQKLHKMCSECMGENELRPEIIWREIIENNFEFKPSTIDEYVYTENCTTNRYRSDLTFHTPNLIIILELDEDSHVRYEADCEIKRTVNMKDAYPDQKVLMIRMNPDKNHEVPEELISLEARTLYMLEVMKQYLDINGELYQELEDGITNVVYLFYSNNGKKHILEAEKYIGSVNVIDTHYC